MSAPKRYLQVRNWKRFQHYHDRAPKWIKLYTELLYDEDFLALTDAQRGQLMMLWLLAAMNDNKIIDDPAFIKRRIAASGPVKLTKFASSGYLERYVAKKKGDKEPWASRYVSAAMRQEILNRDNHCCIECGSTKNLEIDHIVPVSKGGDGRRENLQTLCRSCNRSKHNVEKCYADATQKHDMRSLETEVEREKEKAVRVVAGDPQPLAAEPRRLLERLRRKAA